MTGFIELIGWLTILLPLVWISGYVYFATVPTFGESLFTGDMFSKILGLALWGILITLWYWWLSAGVS